MIDQLKYNRKILKILTRMIERYPEQRFTQILTNLNLENCNNRYCEDSKETYEILKEKAKDFKLGASDFLINELTKLCKKYPKISIEYTYDNYNHIVRADNIDEDTLREELFLRMRFISLYPEEGITLRESSSDHITNCLFKYN